MRWSVILVNTFLLFSTGSLFSQSTASFIRELKVGDQCPDFQFGELLNYTKRDVKLSDFRGALVILDFWATWCKPCVDALPKLDTLQQNIKGQIVILPVTYQNRGIVSKFINDSKPLMGLKLPIIAGDTILYKYFPHRILPHEVWIGKQGQVLSITGPEQVNIENIRQYLKNGKLPTKEKQDVLGFDHRQPILFGGYNGKPGPIEKNRLINSSLFMAYIDGLASLDTGPIIGDSTVMIKCVNSTIESLYQSAYGTFAANNEYVEGKTSDFLLRQPYRTIWEARDSSRYYWAGRDRNEMIALPKEEWLFNYEIILPKKDSLKVNEYMAQDLNKYLGDKFGIEGVKEKRTIKCWVLKRTSKKDQLKSKGGIHSGLIDSNLNRLKVTNMTIKEFFLQWSMFLQRYQFRIPLVDETNYKDNIDIDINATVNDINSINEGLTNYGIRFFLEDRTLEMIIIRDKK